MFIRTNRVRKGDKVYVYAQLVESFRRGEDGKPRQKLIASLGRLSELEVENLRVALEASRSGASVVQQGDVPAGAVLVRKSLDYLPIAVILQMARQLGLADLLGRLLDRAATSVPISKVVLALVAHRLVAPGSKIAAVRWFDRTALPELLGVERSELNNSRVHRVLDALDQVRPELQHGLSLLYRDATEAGGVLFMDVSDTWFEGRGPDLAQRHRTKEGVFKKKIGIVLTVSRRGEPLRWEVVEGRRHDSQTMGEMARALMQNPWMRSLPIVFDRAMGKQKHLEELTEAGVRFLTMLTRESFPGYAWEDLHVPRLQDIEVRDANDDLAQAAAIGALSDAGFTAVGRRLWAKDLGVRQHRKPQKQVRRRPPRQAQEIQLAEELTERKTKSGKRYKDVAAEMGLSWGRAKHLRLLMKLTPEIREVIREGGCNAVLYKLEKVAMLEPEDQRAAFELLTLDHEAQEEAAVAEAASEFGFSGPPLRLILVVDPVGFTAARAAAMQQEMELGQAIERLSRRLADGRITQKFVERRGASLLQEYELSDCYDIALTCVGATLQRREEAWRRRRACDGVRLFALHPELETSPQETVELYSAKMAVEIDFHVIKSTVRIRPVHHNTDAKVRAHVDLCVLALAIERALDRALPDHSAPAALELLEGVRLTEISGPTSKPMRIITTPDQEQESILQHLGMQSLATQIPQ